MSAHARISFLIVIAIVLSLSPHAVTGEIDITRRNEPVDCDQCTGSDCDDCEDGKPVVRAPAATVACGAAGGLADFQVCVVDELDQDYLVTPTSTGVDIDDGVQEPDCLGIDESRPEVRYVAVELYSTNNVARLEHFVASSGFGPANHTIEIEINNRSFNVSLGPLMTIAQINDAVENAIGTRFEITSHVGAGTPDYWIIGEEIHTGNAPTFVSVAVELQSLSATSLELRPERSDESAYDVYCGEPGY